MNPVVIQIIAKGLRYGAFVILETVTKELGKDKRFNPRRDRVPETTDEW